MLNEEDKLLARKIIDINIEIKECYDNLEKLEENGEKKTNFYQLEFLRAKALIAKEKRLLALLKGEPEKMVLICNELNFSQDFSFNLNIANELESLTANNAENLIRFRLINQLFALFMLESNTYFNVSFQQITNEESREYILIDQKVQMDFINTVLAILKLYLGDSRFQGIKGNLLTLKYNLAFLHEEIETDLLSSEFTINSYLYWQAFNYLKALHFSPEFIKEKLQPFQYGLGDAVFNQQIETIICTEAENLQVDQMSSSYVMAQIFLRAALLFLGEDAVNDLKTKYKLEYHGEKEVDGINVWEMVNEANLRITNLLGLYSRDKNLLRKL